MTRKLPPIVVSRRERTIEGRWQGARSWFGGVPCLGDQPWPTCPRTGKPLPFAAQLDLAELALAKRIWPLPPGGSLAFFLGAGAVVHVPADAHRRPTRTPEGVTPAYDPAGGLFPERPSHWAKQTFPYWPVEFTALETGDVPGELPDDAVYAHMEAAVSRRFVRRNYFFSARSAFEAIGVSGTPMWWHGAQRYIEKLKIARFHSVGIAKARVAGLEAARAEAMRLEPKKIFGLFERRGEPSGAFAEALITLDQHEEQYDGLQRQLTGLDQFIAAVESFAGDKDPWALMAPDETKQFATMFEHAKQAFPELLRNRIPYRIDDLATESLLAMTTGDEMAFSAMPPAILDLINRDYRLPTQGWHQVLGLGLNIQGNAAAENDSKHMLLQLVYDDMMGWRFGDLGAFQFWISPRDLEAGNWDGATLSFESC
ncbi:hypothetical protein A7A08_01387 [Methyloligella halotolerans]|uniref:DUF1963 domain-containing protein n=1 Tax=Methyloligella halotolerans TaxID=1177755 RepID=A0A1E2RYN8_9HYPH|nr:DUF1963 domain-containing protein [Methyloligella halotolerans]ODA67356.1 hypothetical protein A7A08_01387 [Methyloligella halotolerans]